MYYSLKSGLISSQVFPNKSLYDAWFQPSVMQFLKSCVHFSPITYMHMPCSPPRFDYPNSIWWKVQIMNFSLCCFPQVLSLPLFMHKIYPISSQLLINLPTPHTDPLWLQYFTQFSSTSHLEQPHFKQKFAYL